MVAGLRFILSLVAGEQMAPFVGRLEQPPYEVVESDEALEAWLVTQVGTGYHLVGTCKMGPAADPLAVVDEHLSIHGIEGLWVADASVMPTNIRANPNLTTIMIAERLADWLTRPS
jgi:choline dehydrogenase-like flavoprotein